MRRCFDVLSLSAVTGIAGGWASTYGYLMKWALVVAMRMGSGFRCLAVLDWLDWFCTHMGSSLIGFRRLDQAWGAFISLDGCYLVSYGEGTIRASLWSCNLRGRCLCAGYVWCFPHFGLVLNGGCPVSARKAGPMSIVGLSK